MNKGAGWPKLARFCFVENYFKLIIHEENNPCIDSAPITISMRGVFKAPVEFDIKQG